LGEYYEEKAGARMINSILELCKKREPMPQLSVEERNMYLKPGKDDIETLWERF
jgi:hypothetical protein